MLSPWKGNGFKAVGGKGRVTLGRASKGTLIVIESGKTTRRMVTDLRGRIDGSGFEPIGVVFNKVDANPDIKIQHFSCDVGCGGVGPQLLDGLGANDDRRHGRAGQQPGQRNLVRLQPPFPAQPLNLPSDRKLGVGEPGPGVGGAGGMTRVADPSQSTRHHGVASTSWAKCSA